MHIDWQNMPIPIPMALALVAAVGYLVSRLHPPAASEQDDLPAT